MAPGVVTSRAVDSRLTIPNLLTIARIGMALVAAALVISGRDHAVALSLLVAGALIDVFDGWYARAFAQASHMGKHLDPFADKVLVAVMYAWIGSDAASPLVWTGIGLVLAREVAVTALRSWSLRRHGRFIPAGGLGRLKMFLQCSTGMTILGITHWLGRPVPEALAVAALVAVLVVSGLSAARYARDLRRAVRAAARATDAAGDGERVAGIR